MQLFEQQQFEFLMQTAVERFVERSEQRFQGAATALERWKQQPQQLADWLGGFCDAIFEDFLLNNADGACFVLRAMAQHQLQVSGSDPADKCQAPAIGEHATVEGHLIELAKALFRRLLYRKTLETLELHSSYQAV